MRYNKWVIRDPLIFTAEKKDMMWVGTCNMIGMVETAYTLDVLYERIRDVLNREFAAKQKAIDMEEWFKDREIRYEHQEDKRRPSVVYQYELIVRHVTEESISDG